MAFNVDRQQVAGQVDTSLAGLQTVGANGILQLGNANRAAYYFDSASGNGIEIQGTLTIPRSETLITRFGNSTGTGIDINGGGHVTIEGGTEDNPHIFLQNWGANNTNATHGANGTTTTMTFAQGTLTIPADRFAQIDGNRAFDTTDAGANQPINFRIAGTLIMNNTDTVGVNVPAFRFHFNADYPADQVFNELRLNGYDYLDVSRGEAAGAVPNTVRAIGNSSVVGDNNVNDLVNRFGFYSFADAATTTPNLLLNTPSTDDLLLNAFVIDSYLPADGVDYPSFSGRFINAGVENGSGIFVASRNVIFDIDNDIFLPETNVEEFTVSGVTDTDTASTRTYNLRGDTTGAATSALGTDTDGNLVGKNDPANATTDATISIRPVNNSLSILVAGSPTTVRSVRMCAGGIAAADGAAFNNRDNVLAPARFHQEGETVYFGRLDKAIGSTAMAFFNGTDADETFAHAAADVDDTLITSITDFSTRAIDTDITVTALSPGDTTVTVTIADDVELDDVYLAIKRAMVGLYQAAPHDVNLTGGATSADYTRNLIADNSQWTVTGPHSLQRNGFHQSFNGTLAGGADLPVSLTIDESGIFSPATGLLTVYIDDVVTTVPDDGVLSVSTGDVVDIVYSGSGQSDFFQRVTVGTDNATAIVSTAQVFYTNGDEAAAATLLTSAAPVAGVMTITVNNNDGGSAAVVSEALQETVLGTLNYNLLIQQTQETDHIISLGPTSGAQVDGDHVQFTADAAYTIGYVEAANDTSLVTTVAGMFTPTGGSPIVSEIGVTIGQLDGFDPGITNAQINEAVERINANTDAEASTVNTGITDLGTQATTNTDTLSAQLGNVGRNVTGG